MKIRKGFVTNSSATNFGIMIVTSLASITAASFLSYLEQQFGPDKSKKKDMVDLFIEKTFSFGFKPGDSAYVRGRLLKASIIDGVLKDDVSDAGVVYINIIKGEELLGNVSGVGEADLSFTVKGQDKEKEMVLVNEEILVSIQADYSGDVPQHFSYRTSFSVPILYVNPEMDVFFAGQGTKNTASFMANYATRLYWNGVDQCNMLEAKETKVVKGKLSKSTYEFTECLDADGVEKYFGNTKAKIDHNFILSDFKGKMKDYTARIIKESIIVPPKLEQPFKIKCFPDEDAQLRLDDAFLLQVKVMKYDKDTQDVVCDLYLTNNLQIEFVADSKATNITYERAEATVEGAEIRVRLHPDKGPATTTKPYATYQIYSNRFVEADVDCDYVDMLATISCNDPDISDVILKAKLIPQINYKDMIKWFIEYPQGTLIDKHVKLGDVATYWGALDFIENRVVAMSQAQRPRSAENHYEAGTIVPSRPRAVILRDSMKPRRIGEFDKIQSLHHELTHAIEDQHGDIKIVGGHPAGGERHAWYVQYLSDAAKVLSDLERAFPANLSAAVKVAIDKYHMVYFNQQNGQPVNYNTFDWFGVETPTQHCIIEKYALFNVYCESTNLTDEQKERIAKEFRHQYFPGNIQGKFKETDGYFKDAEWRFIWIDGWVSNVKVVVPKVQFTEVSREWVPEKLTLRFVFDIKTEDGTLDSLIAELEAGDYNKFDYHYPSVNEFNITWKPALEVKDCILGKHMNKTYKLVR